MNHSLKYRRFSEKQIRAILSIQEKDNLAVTAFCKSHNIHKATYYNWRSKYGMQSKTTAQFIPVRLEQSQSVPALFGEIELPTKVIVRLYQRVDAVWVKSLLS
jgi:transposase-like protein